MEQTSDNQSINIELPEEVAGGVYSNLAIVMNSQSEFVLDFVRLLPGQQSAQVCSRIIMTPDNVKRLIRVLQQNIHSFEQEYGEIFLNEDALPAEAYPQGEA
ncbi:DUF3467 domain-containing protein [Porphyromonas sp. COT-239 OH1446]|uniref:DUF3467 domain-containing protein n=1 Tax=Porphyromonas sp. COT-239 OH1446 TaxID=1515613 RepID=UPI00052CBC33|nr:DUF3467 domain-containing protein [Porphyromonas sp. COT-239 OH1446]KGN71424.1 hypothetical protein HQ37_03000 [Porphyromonas sp. COT-239 OH1446]